MKNIYLSIVALLMTIASFGQLTGIKTIPGSYSSIALAIADLNLQGVGSGGVTFNITAGYTETASNLIITATGTLANPIVFQKSGSGADPLITASPGVSATMDGIIIFSGCDYVTFNGIDLLDPVTNTTATTQMEWGYAVLKNSGTDGCQNITIINCTITLQRIYGSSVGIYVNNHTTASTTALTVTSAAGTNSNNKFYGNTIKNINTGILITGFADVSPYIYYDQNNDIGGSLLATGNTINDFGGVANITAYGISVISQNGCNISFNTINNTAGGGIASVYILYGISHGTGVNSNSTMNNNTISLTQGNNTRNVYNISSTITGTGTVNVNNNLFQNSSMVSGASGVFYCIYLSGSPAVSTFTGNQFINCTTLATTGNVFFIYNPVNTPTVTVNGNTVNNVSKTSAGNGFYGYYNIGSPTGGTETVNGNTISNVTVTGATSFYGLYYSGGSTTQNRSWYNNTITSITGGSLLMDGLYVSSGNIINIYGNTINTISNGNGTTGAGIIYINYIGGGTNAAIYSNTAYGITNSNSGAVYGLYIGGGTNVSAYKNSFYNISGSNAATLTYGIYVSSGTSVNIYNNFLSDLRATAATGLTAVAGLYFSGGTNIGAYYNTVFLNAVSTSATTFGASGIYSTSTPNLDLRNNIVVNLSTPLGATGYTVAYRRSNTTLTTYSSLSNNNDFYAGTPGPANLLFYDGTNSSQTLTAYKTFISPRDGQSITENPPFVNITVKPYDLHLSATLATSCESGGTTVSGPVNITDDFDGQARFPNSGYPNNVTYPAVAPDMGADEFAGIPLDVNPPMISLTPLSNTSSLLTRTLTTTISDQSGVPTSGTGLPRLYWKINGGSWNNVAGVFVSGNQYTFSFGAGVVLGDVVSYYIVAQDNVTPTPFVGSNPLPGAAGYTFNPPAASTPPTTPFTYTIIGSLCGTYSVGTGQTYTTLTAAITDLNAKEITCPVIFQLTDPTYASETFPIIINSNIGSGATNTVTIKPASGVTAAISGSSATALIKFNSASYITINGSNSGGTDQSLTFSNTVASGTTTVIWVGSNGTNAGSRYITIKNCNINNGYNAASSSGIVAGSASSLITGGDDNDNLTIRNNNISKAFVGILAQAATVTGSLDNLQIIGNTIGSSTATSYIGQNGIIVAYANGALISQNTVFNIITTNTAPVGITISTGVVNTTISKNNINNVAYSGTSGYGGWGLYISTGNAAGNLTVENNLVSVIGGDGWNAFSNSSPVGIYFDGTTGGLNIYGNSVYMSGNLTQNLLTLSTCILFNSATITNIDLRDNIFENAMNNTANSTAKNYAIYSSTAAVNFTQINNNDYFVSGTQGILGYLGADKTTLAAWKTATSQDVSSVNIDPAFTSVTDLHTTAVGLNNQGVTIALLPDDFTGVTRSNPPDMGAYEFSLVPVVVTTAATAVSGTSATLNGTVNANNESVITGFDYGLTIAYGSSTPGVPSIITGTSAAPFMAGLINLIPNTLYHYRATVTVGGVTTYGNDMTFTTLMAPPVVVTTAATGVGNTTATVNGTVNPNNSSTTVSFDYGLTIAYGTTIAGVPSPVTGSITTPFSAALSGLQINTLYHYRAKGVNGGGTSYGNDMTFTTLCPIPGSAGIISGTSTLCAGTTGVVYTVNPVTYASGYIWTLPTGGTIIAGANTNSITVQYSPSAVSGNVTVYAYNACGNGPTSTLAITIYPLPVPTITGNSSVCVNSTGNVYTTQAGMTNYIWTVSSGGTITAGGGPTNNTVTITWITAGARTVSVNYTNSNGCTATSPTVYNVTVNALPVPTITGPASLCAQATGVTYTTETGMSGYVWTVSAGGTITSGSGTKTITVMWNTSGAQTVSVNYTNSNGCTAATPTVKNVTVFALPVPTITGLGTVCAGTTGVTYTTETGMTGYTWALSAGGIITSGVNTNVITVTWVAAGAQTVSVNYTNSNGCTALTPTVKNVTVNALPVPTITGPASVCVGTTGVTYTTETGMSSYVWTVSSGGTITAGAGTKTITVTWGTAGSQTVSVNYTNSNGCTATTATVKNVTVNSLPVPTLTGPSSLCAGTSGVTYYTESGMTTYIWSVSAGGTITSGGTTTSSTVTITWNTAGTQTVSVNYTDPNGCTAVSPVVKNVQVNALPAPTITGPVSVCVGSTGNLYTTQTGMTNYIWTVSAGGTITSGGSSTNGYMTVTWNTVGSKTVSVNYTNSNGCTAGSPTVKNVTVNPLPVPTITGIGAVCAGTTGVTYTTESGMTNYSWVISSGGIITAGGTTNTVTVTWYTPGNQTLTVNYTNTNGCTANYPTIKNITVYALPLPSIIGPVTLCVGTTGIIYSTESGKTNYTWTISAGGTITAGLGTDSITVSWNAAGYQTISVNYNDANGCTAASPFVKTILVNSLPVPSLTGSITVCAGTYGVFYTTETGMSNYLWTVSAGGIITSGAGTRMITVNWITAGAQTVSVSYTNTNGCTALNPTVKNVTVNPLPVPTITGAASVCAGTQGVIYTTEPGMAYYVWTKSSGGTVTAGGTSTSNTITITWNTAGNQYVSVNYTNTNNCMAASPTVYPVTVNPLPVPTITGANSVCAGTTGVVYTTQTGMTNYSWHVSTGGTITSGGSPTDYTVTVTWNTAGTQSVTINYTNGNGCSAPYPITYPVTVKSLPNPTLTGPTPVCAGTTGNVYTTQSGMTNYVWTVSSGGTITAGGTSTRNNVTVTWNTAGAQTVSVNYTGLNGCNAANATVFHVTVNPLPVPTITGNSNLCAGISGTYTTQSGMTSYSWSVASGATIISGGTSTSNTITVKWNIAGSDWVKVNYTNANGCRASIPTQFNITVNALPVPSVTGNKSVCAGTTGVIYTTQPGMTNYVWTISTGGTITSGGGTNAITVTWNTAGSQWVRVNYTNTNGCTAIYPTQYAVTVNPIPVPSLSGPLSICVNTSCTYTTDPGMTNYIWTVSAGGTITSGNGTRTITVLWNTSGAQTVSVIYTNTLGCPVTVPTVKNVTVYPLPVPTITGPASVCVGTIVYYSTQPGMTYYTWTLGGSGGIIYSGFNSYQIQVKWTLTGNKTVSVNYSAAGGCRASSPTVLNVTVHTCPFSPVTGIEEDLQANDILVYPNPNNGQFTVSIQCPCEDNCDISIFNILGVRVYEINDIIVNGTLKQNIDLSDIPEGLYWMIFRKSDRSVVKKIVISK